MEQIKPGLVGEATAVVTLDKTARVMGSGSVEVFATPAMIALMEQAAVAAIDGLLPEGQTSVGTGVNINHFAATMPGQQVRAVATVTEVSGRHITFEVRAWDDGQEIGNGIHKRYVIDEQRFLTSLQEALERANNKKG